MNQRAPSLSRSAVCLGLVTLVSLAACDAPKKASDDDDGAARRDRRPSAAATVATSTGTVQPAVAPGSAAAGTAPDLSEGDQALLFFRSQLPACNQHAVSSGNADKPPFDGSATDPTRSLRAVGPRLTGFLIADADGVELLVDRAGKRITGPQGAAGPMPRPYLFLCPPEIFVGTMDEGPAEPAAPAPAAGLPPSAATSCKASTKPSLGAWRPTADDVRRAAEGVEPSCTTSAVLAASLLGCIAQVGAPLVAVDIAAPDHSACSVELAAAEWGGHRHIAFYAFIGKDARFHGVNDVRRQIGSGWEMYYRNFLGGAPCEGQLAGDPDAESPALKADWAGLGEAERKFVCGG